MQPATRFHGPAGHLASLPIMLIAVTLAAPVVHGDDKPTLDESMKRLIKVRDELQRRYEQRLKDDLAKGPCNDVVLRLDNAADGEQLDVTLRQRGGEWLAAHAVVPAWRQETMQEKFYFHHNQQTNTVRRDKQRFQVAPEGLVLEDNSLSGRLHATLGIDLLRHEREPWDKEFSWWDRFQVIGYTQPREQTYELDVAVLPDRHTFTLTLVGGLSWPGRRGEQSRRPIEVCFDLPGDRWTKPRVYTRTWNGGFHQADASELTFADGQLTGKLVVTLHSDRWFPKDKKPRVQTFGIFAKFHDGSLRGSYRSEGALGKYEGPMIGNGGAAVQGWYRATGAMGGHAGRVSGYVAQVSAGPAAHMLAMGAQQPTEHVSDFATGYYQQIRALDRALAAYPLPSHVTLRQVRDMPLLRWPDGSDDELGAWVNRLATLAETKAATRQAKRTAPQRGPVTPRDVRFGPYAETSALAANRIPASVDDNGPDRWQFIEQWSVLGPLPVVDGREMDEAALPDLLPAPSMYAQPDVLHVEGRGVQLPQRGPIEWTTAKATGGLLRPAWEKGHLFARANPALWYAASTVSSDTDRKVWLAISANDHAKLWVNDELVWVDAEKPWAYRDRRRAVFQVDLRKGENRLLVRCRSDRRDGWVRLHVCTRGGPSPNTSADTPADGRQSDRKPSPDSADTSPAPPIAWDIDKGTNVAWRTPIKGGRAQPAVGGANLFVSGDPFTLHCLDPNTGNVKWARESNVLEVIAPDDFKAWGNTDDAAKRLALLQKHDLVSSKASHFGGLGSVTPVADDKHVWVHYPTGVAACYDHAGNRRWIVRTPLEGAAAHLAGDVLVLEGEPSRQWPADADAEAGKRKKKKGDGGHGMVGISATTGKIIYRKRISGPLPRHRSKAIALTRGDTTRHIVLTSNAKGIDAATGDIIFERVDADPEGSYHVSVRDGRVYFTAMDDKTAVDFWLDESGRVCHGALWHNHQEITGFFNVGATSAARGDRLYTWSAVLERGPHCPMPRVEVNVYDRNTGKRLHRIKPAMDSAVNHMIDPAIHGEYLYVCDAGGGSHGGLQSHGQITVVHAGETPTIAAQNRVDLGTSAPPVFLGDRMFLRSPRGVVCIAVTDEAGRRYQAQHVAEKLFDQIGREPRPTKLLQLDAADSKALRQNAPMLPFESGQGLNQWLTVDPFVLPDEASEGEPMEQFLRQFEAKDFRPVDPRFSITEGPHYVEYYNLQGRGMRFPGFRKRFDAAAFIDSREKVGLFYTQIESGQERVVTPVLPDHVTMWLGGTRMAPNRPVRLEPGRYRMVMLVRSTPPVPEPAPPINLAKALEARAATPVDLSGGWRAIGPMPANNLTLNPARLARLGKTVTLGKQPFVVQQLPTQTGGLVDLAPLLGIAPDQELKDLPTGRQEVPIKSETIGYAWKQFECPEDGHIVINACADWFMTWYMDGEEVFSNWTRGNGTSPTSIGAHTIAAPVTKGKHIIAVRVKAGSKGWSFHAMAGFTTQRPAALAKDHPEPRGIRPPPPPRGIIVGLRELQDLQRTHDLWLDRARALRPRLQWIMRQLPRSKEASKAHALLERID